MKLVNKPVKHLMSKKLASSLERACQQSFCSLTHFLSNKLLINVKKKSSHWGKKKRIFSNNWNIGSRKNLQLRTRNRRSRADHPSLSQWPFHPETLRAKTTLTNYIKHITVLLICTVNAVIFKLLLTSHLKCDLAKKTITLPIDYTLIGLEISSIFSRSELIWQYWQTCCFALARGSTETV